MSFALLTALNDLRRRLRDPMSFLLWLGIPLAIAAMIRLAFGGQGGGGPRAEVLVADLDDSFLSSFLLGALSRAEGGELPFDAEAVELEEGRRRIEDGDGSALLVIPEGFSEALLEETPCTLELVTNPAQRILPGMVEGALELLVDGSFYVHRVFGEPIQSMLQEPVAGAHTLPDEEVTRISIQMNAIVERVAELLDPPAIQMVVDQPAEEEGGGGVNFGALYFPSMLFMTLFFLAQGLTEDLWVEKRSGTLRRALTTPNRPAAFLAGKLGSAVVILAAVSLFGLLVGRVAFGLELTNLPLAVAWSAVAGAFLTLLMLLLQIHATSQRAANLLANLVMMPLLMLGGSFFPFEAMPDGMAAIGRKTPNGWALEQLKTILLGTAEPGALALAFLGLVAVSAVLFLVSCRRMAGAFARG